MKYLKSYLRKKLFLFKLVRKVYIIIKKIECIIVKLFSLKLENKVVFSSYKGKAYSDSPRKISELLHAKYPEIEIVWLFNDLEAKANIVPSYVRMVKRKTLREKYELYTAKCWVDNFPKEVYEIKTKNQLYIYTSHGDRPIKKFALDKEDRHGRPIRMLESKKCDLFIVGSDMGEKVARSAYGYTGEIMKKGTPRNDSLVRKKYKEENKDFRIVLFAPTFRNENKGKKQSVEELNISEMINVLSKKTGEKWKCYVRGHSAVDGIEGCVFSENVVDVSDYEDMEELMRISDILITDYSSCAGDFIVQYKPVILFQPDFKEYCKNDRELYYNQEELPYWIAKSSDELFTILNLIDENAIEERCKFVCDFYGICESGASTEAIVEYVYDFLRR